MKEDKKEEQMDQKFNKLLKKMLDLLKVNAISVSALQLKNTEAIISEKLENEKNAIEYGMNSINKNVLKNQKKYSNILEKESDLLDRYKKLITDVAKYYDNNILMENIKILNEELFQLEQNKKLTVLKEKEAKAREKLDNSDDVIAEEAYDVEEEISKSQVKVKRLKTSLKNKIKEKETALFSAVETKEKELQKEIKGPRVIKNATRFFMGKINPYKMIEKNVFKSLENRLNEYEEEIKSILKKKIKYSDENIVSTINELVEKAQKDIVN